MSTTGWYVHHHGSGHLTRFLAVRPHVPGDVVVFSSLPPLPTLPSATDWVHLPRDDDAAPAGSKAWADPAGSDPTARGLLHWAPLGHPGHRRRLAAIADVARDRDLRTLVVDVSVEVTLWARLLGLRAVVVAQPGERTDRAHALAYAAAEAVVAPWPRGLVHAPALDPVRERVAFVGGVSRFDGRPRPAAPHERRLLVLGGVAGAESLADAAALPGWRVTAVGGSGKSWHEDPWGLLCGAAVVVSAGGQNSVADLAAAGARALVVPQERPFAEQHATATALREHGLAVVRERWPSGDVLPAALEQALALKPDWPRWQVAGAAARAAAVIDGASP